MKLKIISRQFQCSVESASYRTRTDKICEYTLEKKQKELGLYFFCHL